MPSGEAGGDREAAAGERSLHEIKVCDVGGGCIVRVGMGPWAQGAARCEICLCCVLLSNACSTQKTSVDSHGTAVCNCCLHVQVRETAARLQTTIILSCAMLQESLPQISPDRVAVALFALTSSDVDWQPDS